MFKENDLKISLKESSCVLMICPGDRKFTNKSNLNKIVAALRLANFMMVDVIVADGGLQACSKQIKQGSNFAEIELKNYRFLQDESNQEGLKWKNNNLSILKKLPHVTVYHWDDIITNNESFSACYSKAEELYKSNENFRAAIDESIKPYLKKYVKTHNTSVETLKKQHLSYKEAKKISLKYKLSEVAGLLIKELLGYKFLAYPGNLCPGLQYVFDSMTKELTFLKVNLNSKIQKILLRNGIPTIGSAETHKNTIEIQNVTSPTTYGKTQRTFFKPHPIFTQVEFLLQNCRNSNEMMYIVTILNTITAKYMLANTIQTDRQNGKNNKMFAQKQFLNLQVDGDNKIDGGLEYQNYYTEHKTANYHS